MIKDTLNNKNAYIQAYQSLDQFIFVAKNSKYGDRFKAFGKIQSELTQTDVNSLINNKYYKSDSTIQKSITALNNMRHIDKVFHADLIVDYEYDIGKLQTRLIDLKDITLKNKTTGNYSISESEYDYFLNGPSDQHYLAFIQYYISDNIEKCRYILINSVDMMTYANVNRLFKKQIGNDKNYYLLNLQEVYNTGKYVIIQENE